jgi:hypothetical protein
MINQTSQTNTRATARVRLWQPIHDAGNKPNTMNRFLQADL